MKNAYRAKGLVPGLLLLTKPFPARGGLNHSTEGPVLHHVALPSNSVFIQEHTIHPVQRSYNPYLLTLSHY